MQFEISYKGLEGVAAEDGYVTFRIINPVDPTMLKYINKLELLMELCTQYNRPMQVDGNDLYVQVHVESIIPVLEGEQPPTFQKQFFEALASSALEDFREAPEHEKELFAERAEAIRNANSIEGALIISLGVDARNKIDLLQVLKTLSKVIERDAASTLEEIVNYFYDL